MPIIVKNNEQIEYMRKSCKIVALTLEKLEKEIKIGMTTLELDKIAEDFIRSHDAIPSFKGYGDFPGSICASINEEIIHGIPGKRKLQDGDIISIDVGAYKNGYHGDAARTFLVGNVSDDKKQLVEETKNSFFYAIEDARENNYLYKMSGRVEEYVKKFNYGVVRDFVGHGIGQNLHESPEITNFIRKAKGPKLTRGMTLAIEPMINMGTHELEILDDNWTTVTLDGKPSAHYENTILITDGEPEILTIY